MAQEVTRTFDILERYQNEFPRKDALGGKKDGNWYTFSTEASMVMLKCSGFGFAPDST